MKWLIELFWYDSGYSYLPAERRYVFWENNLITGYSRLKSS